MIERKTITGRLIHFIRTLQYDDLPPQAITIARRCMLDTYGLYIAAAGDPSVRLLAEEARDQGGRTDATLLGGGGLKVPVALAARVLGTAGHAQDWDDTQVSHDPLHSYGMLMHPSVPVLTAALMTGEYLGGISGKQLMLAFQTGFEVECKISEWMLPDHYRRGHHSSGTVGTFGACAAAAKLLELDSTQTGHALGMAASFASGIRCNYGTMTKPLHVGRAAENGITAALLARKGFTADPTALDGRWGFMQVTGAGHSPEKVLAAGLAAPLSIVSPGVSVKPYPSGILTHQAMDALLALVTENDLKPDDVRQIRLYAGSNLIDPIRYTLAKNHLQAKFSMQALLAMIVLRRQAGPDEFTDAFVASPEMQAMQQRIQVIHDEEIETMGFELIRSRLSIDTRDGRQLDKTSDTRYRGGPSKPMTDAEIESKFRLCTSGRLSQADQKALAHCLWTIETQDSLGLLIRTLANVPQAGADAVR